MNWCHSKLLAHTIAYSFVTQDIFGGKDVLYNIWMPGEIISLGEFSVNSLHGALQYLSRWALLQQQSPTGMKSSTANERIRWGLEQTTDFFFGTYPNKGGGGGPMKESKEKGLIWPRQYFNDVSIVSNEAFLFLPSGVRPLRLSLYFFDKGPHSLPLIARVL